MKTGKFLVKANYIKPAKEEWVICEVRLLTDNTDNFLCIKSMCPSDINFDDVRSLAGTDISFNGTLTSTTTTNTNTNQTMTMGSLANRPFTALCNLGEYRSCDIRTTTINGRGTFALKLVPSGILSQKRLLMATDDEEQLTAWLSILKGLVGKRQVQQAALRRSLAAQNSTGSSVMLPPPSALGSVSNMGTLDRRSQDTFSFEDDDDADLTENDIYEPYSVGDYTQAVVEDTPDARRLNLHGEIFLRTAPNDLEICEITSRRVLYKLPYKYIRRFGAKQGCLRVEAGRRCSTGDGMFTFRTDHSPEISIFIREAARKVRDQPSATPSAASSILSLTNQGSPHLPSANHSSPDTQHRQQRTNGSSSSSMAAMETRSNRSSVSTLVSTAGSNPVKYLSPANAGDSKQDLVSGEFIARPGWAASQNENQTFLEGTKNETICPDDEVDEVDGDIDPACHYDNMTPETYGNLRCPVVPAPRGLKKGGGGGPDRCLQELDDVLRELGISGADADDDSVEL